MTGIHPTVLVSLRFTLILLITGTALGQFKETYQAPGYILEWNSGSGLFDYPRGITVDASGHVYVADNLNHRIQKFDSAGNFLTEWGGEGTGDGQFNSPLGVEADASGHLYVADETNQRIQKFDSAGNFITKWGSYGTGDGQFGKPADVAVDTSGNVYVADQYNNRIQRFSGNGEFLTKWGSNGSGAGQFSYPSGVAVDASGNVFVADTENHRIQKFDSSGNFLAGWGSSGSGAGEFNGPTDVATDSSGNVYVADYINDRIQKFDSAGNYLTEWGSLGGDAGRFHLPAGVASDALGNVYVADSGNDRIQKFSPVLWFDMAGYDSYLSVAALHETTAVRTLFSLENNGAPRFAFKNTSSDIEWSFQQSGPGNFLISKEGTGGPELQVYGTGMVRMGPGGTNNFTLSSSGNLTIAGSLTANGTYYPSDRNLKENIRRLDPEETLARVQNLEVSRWVYKSDKYELDHAGPMAQDFYDEFGLGKDDKHLNPGDTAGVALAAIQGLNLKLQQELEKKDAEIQSLMARLAEIESLLTDQ